MKVQYKLCISILYFLFETLRSVKYIFFYFFFFFVIISVSTGSPVTYKNALPNPTENAGSAPVR